MLWLSRRRGVTEESAGFRVADKSAGVRLAPSRCKQV